MASRTLIRAALRRNVNASSSVSLLNSNRSSLVLPSRSVKIYTKTGDKGTTSLFSFAGKEAPRRPKNDQIFKTLGDIDELNAHVGSTAAFCKHDPMLRELDEYFYKIQCDLIEAGSAIAFQVNSEDLQKVESGKILYPDYAKFNTDKVLEVESWIDFMDEHLSELTNFILPKGGRSAGQAHISRSICRRAERSILDLKEQEKNNFQNGENSSHLEQLENVAVYLNRLSDFFFNTARFINARQGSEEVIYTPRKPRDHDICHDDDEK